MDEIDVNKLHGNSEAIESVCGVHRDCGIPASPSEVEYAYFLNLCSKVGLNDGYSHLDVWDSDKTHFLLARKLFTTPFRFFVPHDENRNEDGKRLRWAFANIDSAFTDYDVLDGSEANWLEVLVALAEKMDREILRGMDNEDRSFKWFWLFMNNLGFEYYTDNKWNINVDIEVSNRLKKLNDRTYKPDGRGGLFPLKDPPEDQRTTEIWFQMQYYVRENRDLLGKLVEN